MGRAECNQKRDIRMLTRIKIRNFKRFDNVDVELGKAVVLIGPNNSGKTTALQAIALWDIGVRRWNEKRKGKRRVTRMVRLRGNLRSIAAHFNEMPFKLENSTGFCFI